MTKMTDEIVLARIMTALNLKYERALHYHGDKDYDLPVPFMRPINIYMVSMTEASLNPMGYKGAQVPTSPSTPR